MGTVMETYQTGKAPVKDLSFGTTKAESTPLAMNLKVRNGPPADRYKWSHNSTDRGEKTSITHLFSAICRGP